MLAASRLALTVSLIGLMTGALASAGAADQTYRVTGKDSFQIGSRDLRGDIVYDGLQTLAIARNGRATRYSARVTYERIDQGASSKTKGSFDSTLLPTGEQRDDANNDPDYLTVLNQPFAVQLDAQTLSDVAHLHGAVPFTFPSPMTHAVLRGKLRHSGDAMLGNDRACGIAFEARGPMTGGLPDHPEMVMHGSIRMAGTAYYAYRSALLLFVDATLTISGNLSDPRVAGRSDPVTIVYRRTIRPQDATGVREAKR